jgi:hypothetical protein
VKCNASPKRTTSINKASPKRTTSINNASPKRTTSINNVKNYLVRFDPNSIKIVNNRGFGANKRLLTAVMYVNGQKAGNAAIEISPSNVQFNWGGTDNKFRGQQIGRILRALLTKAVMSTGKYKTITHQGTNMGKRSSSRPGGNARPTSTWILQEQLGFRANPVSPMSISEFKLSNNISLINKTLRNYKSGIIGPKSKKKNLNV